MEIKIYWKNKEAKELFNKVTLILEELWISDFIKIKKTTDKKLKEELDIKKDFALIVEEEAIDFKDMIFEGTIPEDEELKSMFVSIIWWSPSSHCSSWECGSGCNLC